jgi:hypothetical protein
MMIVRVSPGEEHRRDLDQAIDDRPPENTTMEDE